MTTPSTGTINNTQNVLSGTQRTPSTELDKDGFLKLLTAQMRNQNPSDSSDPTQQFQVISMMTMVEQLTNMSQTATDEAAAAKASRAEALIGRTVTYPGADGQNVSGVVERVDLGGDKGPRLTVGGVDNIDPGTLVEVR
jgi:flagellar basal-body rod modification protein FlgD